MAIMHPADIENYNYTKTEKEMYSALKTQLPDKYQVFYSVRWFETNSENKRVDSESDFIVFDPSFGFITIEVKGGTGIEVNGNKWILHENYGNGDDGKRELKCSPYEQAEKSMRHFHKYFEEEFNQSFNGVYGFAVAFPRYAISKPLSRSGPLDITIDVNDMLNLKDKINKIFHYWKNKKNVIIPFSAEQRTRFINVINKRISLSAAAGSLIPIKEKEFSKIDFVQETILDCLHNYNQVQIVGGAGTGKTFIGIKKAIRDSLDDKKVLIVCCNLELSKFIKNRISDNYSIDTCTYEQLMLRLLGEKYLLAPINENGNRACFDMLGDISYSDKYDSIIVDEAQDFDVDMGLSIRSLLKNDKSSELYVFYDKNQNIFELPYENAFAISAPPYILRYNIRNTGSIYRCAVERTNLGRDTVANNIIGVEPEIQNYNKATNTIKALTNIINRLVQKEYVSTKSIIIVSDVSFENSILANETKVGAFDITFDSFNETKANQICFKTVEEFKGLESDIVIYLMHDYENMPASKVRNRKEYVAITRARYYLYILNTKIKQ